jgi:hypothetical protein
MSQVIWVNSLIGDKVKGDEHDKPCILKFAGKLDRLCSGGRKFTDFVDYTDAQATVTGNYQGFKDGWELLKHKAGWFAPEDGLVLLNDLIEKIEIEKPRFGLLADCSDEVLKELKNCMATLTEIKKSGGKFHLGVVM